MLRALTTLALASMLAACAGSIDYDAAPVTQLATPQAQAPGDLDDPCADPVRLPERDLGAGEVERLWGRDRASLRICGGRHKANVKWRKKRDAGLAGMADGGR